ncbi:MAG: signal peptide peptidase SppA [Cocleimonas sp.]|nr:signal peptide peptidase SppA [Cocleimonas sp.]
MQNTDKQAMDVLQEVALQGIKEQRRARRWGIFFKLLTFAYLVAIPLLYYAALNGKGDASKKADTYTAVIDLKGVISADSDAGADAIIPPLREAFEDKKVKGIIIRCNSPGGSPVQSGYIYDEIRRLREKHNKPVYAVAADICASGGYYIISAADKIYASQTSLVGSIGVRMDSFGVVGLMEKLGVESRQITAGKNKAMLDPFRPRKEEEVVFIKNLLADTHKHFIDAVKTGRGDRLKDNPDIFTGLIWTGEGAKELGLVDGFGSTSRVARDIVGAKDVVVFSRHKSIMDKLADKIGTKVSTMMMQNDNWRLRY